MKYFFYISVQPCNILYILFIYFIVYLINKEPKLCISYDKEQ